MAEAQKGAWISIISYLVLSLAKIGTGFWANSLGVFADGVNNVSDVLLSVAILIGLRIAVQPADDDHHYGHSKAETVSILIAASFMFLVGVNILIRAFLDLLHPVQIEMPVLALSLSSFSAVIMFGVFTYNLRLSKKTESRALNAAAKDNLADGLVSLGAAGGIIGTMLGYPWFDPVAAFGIGVFIVYTGWQLGNPAIHELMDRVDQKQLEEIQKRVKEIEGIEEVIRLKARHHGSNLYLEITVGVDLHLSVAESHSLTVQVEDHLTGYQNIEHVHVHVEPV